MRVLIVNDDSVSLKFQQLIVERSNIANLIITASNGQEALNYFSSLSNSRSCPKLILLDIDMPVMNGWEFLREFTDKYLPLCKNTKIIITSFTVDHKELKIKAKEYSCVIDFKNTGLTAEYLKDLDRMVF